MENFDIPMARVLSITLSFFRYFGRQQNILVEFVPQIIFLLFLFGYLCLLMFIKWTKYYAGAENSMMISLVTPGFRDDHD